MLILALSAAYFALTISACVEYYGNSTNHSTYDSYVRAYNKSSDIVMAVYAITFVTAVVQVVYAAVIVRQYAGLPTRQIS